MQKGLHVFSKAASIGILSVILRVHRLDCSFSVCQGFGRSNFLWKYHHQHKDPKSFSSSPLSLTNSKGSEDSENSMPAVNTMTSNPNPSTAYIEETRSSQVFVNQRNSINEIHSSPTLSTELSRLTFEVISSCDDVDSMAMLSGQTLNDACRILRHFIRTYKTKRESNDTSELNDDNSDSSCFRDRNVMNESTDDEGLGDIDYLRTNLSAYAAIAAESFCQIASVTENDKDKLGRKSKKRTWEALQSAAGMLQNLPSAATTPALKNETILTPLPLESHALAVCVIFGALSFRQQQDQLHQNESGTAKAAASALSSTISRNDLLRQAGRPISSLLLQRYVDRAFCSNEKCIIFDLNILNHLAKSFKLNEECVEPRVVAAIVRNTVQLADTSDQRDGLFKQQISGAISLASQLRPWSILSPVELMDVATIYDFYHSAEEICRSASNAAKDAEGSLKNSDDNNKHDNEDGDNHRYSASIQERNVRCAVEKLIDIAIQNRMHSRADAMATSLYNMGGRSRYVEARFLHACDTIAKVVTKRMFPIVDRQIERVDKAVAKVGPRDSKGVTHDYDTNDDCNNDHTIGDCAVNGVDKEFPPETFSSSLHRSPSTEIRDFAIQKFEEVGEIVAAQRLASIHNIDYVYDEEAALLAAAARREKYLQYEDVLSGDVQPLITTPDELISGFHRLLRNEEKNSSPNNKQREKHIGFDAEWDEETQGAALLQLASVDVVLLIDILTLSSTEEGVKSLQQTIGKLLDNPEWTMIGFSCRQDLSRLRASPCVPVAQQHWMSGTSAVIDLQPLIGIAEESLRKTGLSRACEHFLSKPLDKSEQCSLWSSRPLTERQRSYASLDAWVCVAIYQKLLCTKNDDKKKSSD